MGAASKVGDWAFKAFTAGLDVATIYLAATFFVNVYRGLSWHNAQSPAKPGTPISKFILRIDYTGTKLSLHEAVHNIVYRHEGELAAAASQPLPDDDDDAFD